MRLGLLAALTLAANLLAFPGFAESAFPKLQRAEPVFEKQAMKNRPSACNGFAGYGATIEQTVQAAVVAPLAAIAEDIARLFRPFFADIKPVGEPTSRAIASKNYRARSPSDIVRTAERRRLCG